MQTLKAHLSFKRTFTAPFGLVMLPLLLLLLTPCQILGNDRYLPLIGTIKVLSKELDSSCIILLHTQQQFYSDRYRIMHLVLAVATDLTIDVCITTLTFEHFSYLFRNNREYLNCKSPIMLIIHEDDDSRKQLEQLSRTLPMQDVNWLCYGKKEMDIWYKDVVISFSTFFISAQEVNKSYVNLYELYRVAHGRPLRSPVFGFWSPTEYLIPTSIIFNRRFNLEGMLFRTGSTQNAPIHSFNYNDDGEAELVGYFPEIWKQLEEVLNFTSVHYASVDNVTGIKEKNGSWNGLIGMLLADQIDVAVSEFIMDGPRSHVIEFTRPLVKTSYQIFFKNVGDNYNWDAVVRPFDKFVWIAILGWVAVGSTVLAFIFSVSRAHGLENQCQPQEFNFINALFFHIKSICSQGHNVIPRGVPCRILYLTAYVVACVLVPSYSASLISYLTFRTPRRPFDNLHGFLNAKTHKLQTNSKTAEYTYFSEATDPTLQKIYQELFVKIPAEDLPLNTLDALERVCQDPHLAHFGDMAAAYSFLQHMKLRRNCDIVTLSQSISTIYSGMALRRHSPYKMLINHFLQRMEDHGIIDRTLDATFPTVKKLSDGETNKVELYDVAQIFILWFSGAGLAWVIFVIEIWQYRRSVENKLTEETLLQKFRLNSFELHTAFIN